MDLEVRVSEKTYRIVMERDSLSHLRDYFDFSDSKVLILSDDGVPSVYREILLEQIENAYSLVVKQGEEAKSAERFLEVQRFLLAHQFQKTDVLLALGGGVVSDLGAFSAAVYKRGMRLIILPTTTLSQIDASVGGKNGINFEGVKNMIGTYYHPDLVLIDTDTLKTLPRRHYFNGLAEALKTGLILNPELYRLFKNREYDERIDRVIFLSLQSKIAVVERDEREANGRMILNFGHTLAHAFESMNHLKGLYHGEAVANGMLYMIDDPDLKKEVREIVEEMNIPLIENPDPEEVIRYVENDKKWRKNALNLVLVREVGKGEIVSSDIEEIRKRIGGGER